MKPGTLVEGGPARFLLAAALALGLSACQATVRIGIDVRSNGSGTVSATILLDRDAARAVPDLGRQLRTADLTAAGWRLDGPRPAAGGGTMVTATKSFATPAEADQVVGELSGATGPFRGLRVVRHRSFLSTTTTFSGTVDLSCGLACFADPQLQQQLGANLGLDPAKLQQAGIAPGQLLAFEVGIRMPGTLRSANTRLRVNGGPGWQVKLGDRASVTATSRALDRTRIVGLVAAAVAVVALVVGGFVVWRRRGRHRSRPHHVPRHVVRR